MSGTIFCISVVATLLFSIAMFAPNLFSQSFRNYTAEIAFGIALVAVFIATWAITHPISVQPLNASP